MGTIGAEGSAMSDGYDQGDDSSSSSGLWIGLAVVGVLLCVCGGLVVLGLVFSFRTAQVQRMEAAAEEAQRQAMQAAEDPDIEESSPVADETGNHRLVLHFARVNRPINGEGKGLDFRSLTWEAREGGAWVERAVISQADFQKGFPRRRWVSKVHSFDPRTAHAILQVAEEGPPDAAGAVPVTYSWREWDMTNNREVRTIRICRDPSEPFEKGKGGR
jgi:hypothetical protein